MTPRSTGASDPGDGLIRAYGYELRRAVLAVLLRAGRPLGIAEIVRRLRADEHVDTDWLDARARDFAPVDEARVQSGVGKVIADLLRHQVAYGRVTRVRRGVYEADRSGMSRSGIHRCLNWRRIRAGEIRGR